MEMFNHSLQKAPPCHIQIVPFPLKPPTANTPWEPSQSAVVSQPLVFPQQLSATSCGSAIHTPLLLQMSKLSSRFNTHSSKTRALIPAGRCGSDYRKKKLLLAKNEHKYSLRILRAWDLSLNPIGSYQNPMSSLPMCLFISINMLES